MKENKQATTNPVLYISQPKLEYPSPKMQSNYISQMANKEQNEKKLELVVSQFEQKEEVKKGSVQKEQKVVTEKTELNKEPKKVTTKPLKEMTIDEKIAYLTNLPKYIPHIPCLIVLENENIIGYIKERVNNTILVDLAKALNITVINIEEILEIHLYVSK